MIKVEIDKDDYDENLDNNIVEVTLGDFNNDKTALKAKLI